MRILHVINSLEIGGAEILLRGLLGEWKDDDHHVVVLQSRGGLSDAIEANASSVVHLGCAKSALAVGSMLLGLRKVVRKLKPDVVHSHLMQSDLVSLLCPMKGVERFTSLHTSGMGSFDSRQSRLVSKLVALLSRRFNAAIATSEKSRDYMNSVGYKCPAVVINNGTPKAEPVDYQNTGCVFLSLARFHEVKGHSILVAAFKRHQARFPESTLVCAGTGVSLSNDDFSDFVGSAAHELSLSGSARFVGPETEIRSLFAAASALVISSLSETFPMVGSEACMHGVPVITTDVGGASAFTMDERWLVKPGSELALAKAFDDFASLSSKDRDDLSRRSREKALKEFDLAQVAVKYSKAYRQFSRGLTESRPECV